ncbi:MULTISPECIES: IS3 family transposase [Mycobacteriales]|uniref:IS3 family transposase n=3 Tax=Mycobacteriales TaxID=85007 RepID=A0A5C5RG68_9ACTN|nr:IS3 family transposase [Mycobacteroides immunogenum]TWS21800.1 IS3 family transposase [Tsukamurella sputi]
MPRQYPQEFRDRGVRMVAEAREDNPQVTEYGAIQKVAAQRGCSQQGLTRWVRKRQIDTGQRTGVTSAGDEEIRRLKRENAELRRANEILKTASAFFAGGARPSRPAMIRYIDRYRHRFGVELICRTLRATDAGFLTSRGYRAARTRPPSDRALMDRELIDELRRIHRDNFSVYGVRKMHAAMRRTGWDIGRDRTARLMKAAGLQGVQRGRKVFTTHPDPTQQRPADLVERHFHASAPNRLWVVDITYTRTWQSMAYTAFVTDVCTRKIVGWAVTPTMRTADLPLEAFNYAIWQTDGADLRDLIHHSDRGSQYLSVIYTDRLAELGITASVGSRGDSYDNALAEAVNAAYKAELIRRGPWKTVEQLELATMEWVHWFNHERLPEALGYRTPVETEAHYKYESRPTLALPTGPE